MPNTILSQEGALQKGAATVNDAHANLLGQITTLRGQMEAIGASWEGAAKVAFDQLMVQWNDDTTKVVKVLERFEQDLLGTQKDFSSTDEQGSSRMRSVAGRLGTTA